MPQTPRPVSGHTCGCIPLRIVVVLYCLYLLVLSGVSLTVGITHAVLSPNPWLFRPWFIFVGGLSFYALCGVILFALLGCIFSVAATLGVKNGDSAMLRAFARFALMRVLVLALIRWCDLAELTSCEDAATPSVDALVAGSFSSCRAAWNAYFIVAAVDSLISCYAAYSASRWCRLNDDKAKMSALPSEATPLQNGKGAHSDVFANIGRPAELNQRREMYQGPPTGIV